MASVITATTTSGLTQSADNSGVLQLASGTGNLVTVPSVTGTAMVSGNMPTFSAYANATTSVAANAFTKVNFQVEEFDTANCFASSRFTANIAGYYLIGGATNITNFVTISIFKNGSEYKRGVQSANVGMYGGSVNGIVYMNGSTDYVEIYVYQSSGTQTTAGVQPETWFNGCLMRAA